MNKYNNRCNNKEAISRIIKYLLMLVIMLALVNLYGCGKDTPVLLSDDSNQSQSQNTINNNYTDMMVYVHISGAVNNPGVVEVNNGSRLFEAIEKAGGFTDTAKTDYCNLAEIVQDGKQYYIPTIEEAAFLNVNSGGNAVVSHYSEDGRLNVNVATKDELMKLPGIGEARANAIIEYREANGLFSEEADIKNVSGIKQSLYDKICDQICIK